MHTSARIVPIHTFPAIIQGMNLIMQ